MLKYAFCIVVCDAFCLPFAHIVYLCNFAQHFHHVGALISLASIGHWGEVRGVCLEDYSLQGNGLERLG